MTLLTVSPHLDDAVFSVGQTLAAHPDVHLLTVLAGDPTGDVLTAYDASCGYGSSREAMTVRRHENDLACTVLDVDHSTGPWLDGQYGSPVDETAVTNWLAGRMTSGMEVLAPLGLGHHDHRVVACAARAAARRQQLPLYVYEELPYRVRDPREACTVLDELTAGGLTVELVVWPVGAEHVKRAAVECYRSQVAPDVRPCLYVPERIWRVV